MIDPLFRVVTVPSSPRFSASVTSYSPFEDSQYYIRIIIRFSSAIEVADFRISTLYGVLFILFNLLHGSKVPITIIEP